MMETRKIRVLIVDDSFFIREILRTLLASQTDIEVVGEARDGAEALALIKTVNPDVVTLDYDMPGMNGVEVINRMYEGGTSKKPRVVMFSSYTQEDAQETFDCLRAGAVDVVAKPSDQAVLHLEDISDEITAKVRQAISAHVHVRGTIDKVSQSKEKRGFKQAFSVAVIGASTGGPPIIEDIIRKIPQTFDGAILIVQHMPPFFTKSFSRRLNGYTNLQVKEAENGEVVSSGTIYLAPGDYHMELTVRGERIFIRLTQDEAVQGHRPSIDVTMKSAAKMFGKHVIGVELTGMGKDGAEGMKAIKDAGGYTIVQDPTTAVVSSMPESSVLLTSIDEIVMPEHIAGRISALYAQHNNT